MRTVAVLIASIILSGCGLRDRIKADEKEMSPSAAFRILAAGAYGAAATRPSDDAFRRAPFVLVARDITELERLWRENIGDQPLPEVDFQRERVVFLLLGAQSSGGYSIDIHGVSREQEGANLEVDATLTQPMTGAMTSQAITAPYSVIAVADRGFSSVEWKSRKQLLARTDLAN